MKPFSAVESLNSWSGSPHHLTMIKDAKLDTQISQTERSLSVTYISNCLRGKVLLSSPQQFA